MTRSYKQQDKYAKALRLLRDNPSLSGRAVALQLGVAHSTLKDWARKNKLQRPLSAVVHKRPDALRQQVLSLARNPRNSYKDIAAHLKVAKSTVSSWCTQAGLYRHKMSHPVKAICNAYTQGNLNLEQIAKQYRSSTAVVRRCLKQGGVTLRPPHTLPRVPPRTLYLLRKQGLSFPKIAKQVNLHPSTVRIRFHRYVKKLQAQGIPA